MAIPSFLPSPFSKGEIGKYCRAGLQPCESNPEGLPYIFIVRACLRLPAGGQGGQG